MRIENEEKFLAVVLLLVCYFPCGIFLRVRAIKTSFQSLLKTDNKSYHLLGSKF